MLETTAPEHAPSVRFACFERCTKSTDLAFFVTLLQLQIGTALAPMSPVSRGFQRRLGSGMISVFKIAIESTNRSILLIQKWHFRCLLQIDVFSDYCGDFLTPYNSGKKG